MALILCKECGREISDAATTCPHCGAPVKPSVPVKSNSKTYMVIAIVVAVITGCLTLYMYSLFSSAAEQAGALFAIVCMLSIVAAIVFHVKNKNGQ